MRTSPIDDGNLNRSFPGDPLGSPTQIIAHFIESELLQRADYLLDIHSGGSSLLYIPSALLTIDPDPDQHLANLEFVKSIGFPQALLFEASGMEYYSSSAAHRKNCVPITLEVAGAGSTDSNALFGLRQGLHSYLNHLGLYIGADDSELPDGMSPSSPEENSISNSSANSSANAKLHQREADIDNPWPFDTQFVTVTGEDCYCYATGNGLFEPLVSLGDNVESGQAAALIHDPETPWRAPETIFFRTSGKVVCRRIPARVQRGDCLFELAQQT